jgi:hypothetical protein
LASHKASPPSFLEIRFAALLLLGPESAETVTV